MSKRFRSNLPIRPLCGRFHFHILNGNIHRQETKHPCVFGLLCLPDDTGHSKIQRWHTAPDVYTRTRAHACDIRALEKGPPSLKTSSFFSTLACAHRVPSKSPFLWSPSSGIFRLFAFIFLSLSIHNFFFLVFCCCRIFYLFFFLFVILLLISILSIFIIFY